MNCDPEFVTAQTDDILVAACQAFIEDEEGTVCSYYMRIENNSNERIQILSKEFNFTDDRGNSFCDNGMGFKGELPELEPGEYFEFADEAPVSFAHSVLYGSCRIVKEKQNQITDIKIPAVPLTGNLDVRCTIN